MAEVIKLVGFEVTLNATANLVSNAVLVKISNANSTTVCTKKNRIVPLRRR